MITVQQFASDREVSIHTVYSWIHRERFKKQKFKIKHYGKAVMIIDLKKKISKQK